MKRIDKKKYQRGASAGRAVRDWEPLFRRLKDAIDWALDIAKRLARDYEEEVEAVERVRSYVHAWLAGRTAEVDFDDILTTLAILFAAIELDLGIDTSPVMEPLRRFPRTLHLPGATREERPTVVIRRLPIRRRNACAAFSQFAA